MGKADWKKEFDRRAKLVHRYATRRGLWSKPYDRPGYAMDRKPTIREILYWAIQEIQELGDAIEHYEQTGKFKKDPKVHNRLNAEVELGDVLLILMNVAEEWGLDFSGALDDKLNWQLRDVDLDMEQIKE